MVCMRKECTDTLTRVSVGLGVEERGTICNFSVLDAAKRSTWRSLEKEGVYHCGISIVVAGNCRV